MLVFGGGGVHGSHDCMEAVEKGFIDNSLLFYMCISERLKNVEVFHPLFHSYVCQQLGTFPWSQGNDGSQEVRLNRKDLVRAVFEALNHSNSGCLIAAEMKPFAESTGILEDLSTDSSCSFSFFSDGLCVWYSLISYSARFGTNYCLSMNWFDYNIVLQDTIGQYRSNVHCILTIIPNYIINSQWSYIKF